MGYYIRYETHQDGPFDLVTMIRKIRKGTIPPETLVMEEKEQEAQPARQHPQLNGFFSEMENDYVSEEAVTTISNLNFSGIMAYGWDFFSNNLIAGFLSGITILATLLYALIIIIATKASVIPSIFLTGIAATFFLCGFIFLLQRLQRQLPFSFSALNEFYGNNWGNITLFSCVFSLIIFTGFLLFIIPGIILLGYIAFAPILVVDRNYHFWHAIESSYHTVKNHKLKLHPIILGLVGLNIIAGIFVLPLLVTLPITFVAVLELYNNLDFN